MSTRHESRLLTVLRVCALVGIWGVWQGAQSAPPAGVYSWQQRSASSQPVEDKAPAALNLAAALRSAERNVPAASLVRPAQFEELELVGGESLPPDFELDPTMGGREYQRVPPPWVIGASDPYWYRGRFWVRAEYLSWWLDSFGAPPLVTSSTIGTSRADAGILGNPQTVVLAGGSDFWDRTRVGGRFELGGWIDQCNTMGVQVNYLFLGDRNYNFEATDATTPILARPFINVEPGFEGPDAELVAYPGLFSGSIQVAASSSFYGYEILYRHAIAQDCLARVDLLAGYRQLDLNDDLLISDTRRALSANTGLPIGTTLSEFDHFGVNNRFTGGELGVVSSCAWCCWSFEGLLTVALGNTRSTVTIDGQTTVTRPVFGGGTVTNVTNSGLLVQATNAGTYQRDQFTMIPEIGVRVGYDVLPCVRTTVGYNLLYWSQVARAGDQIDQELNLSQLVGPLVGAAHPHYPERMTSLVAQGISLGIEGRY